MLGAPRRWLKSSRRLPDPVLFELVGLLYGRVIAIVFMGATTALLGAMVAVRTADAVAGGLAAATVLVNIGRALLIRAYRRHAPLIQTAQEAATWERRFAIGSYTFATLLGLMNARLVMAGDPLVAMLVSALIFGYGAGVVSRYAIRPVICATTLGLAVVPTVAGFVTQIGGWSFSSVAYAVQAALIAGFALTSLETVAQTYRNTLQQLIAKHDLSIVAGQDPLTGLPNRVLLRARLNEGIVRVGETGESLAFHYIDLDCFKAVNDQFGHAAGDALLQAVGERLQATTRLGDTVARIGGDEFIVLQGGVRQPDEAQLLAHRIVRAVSAPYTLEGRDIRIGVSIGIALAPRDGRGLTQLSACADAALYRAKRQGRGGVVIADELTAPAATSTAA
jgi:diguanylate cyclase (GGDEF)-like protein